MRWRRRAKWAGTVAAATIAVAWLWSGWYSTYMWVICRGQMHGFMLARGEFQPYGHLGGRLGAWLDGLRFDGPYRKERGPQWGFVPRFSWDPSGTQEYEISIPLWIPFLLIAAPTVWLWHRDRRRVPGSCVTCGYDLTGTPGGTCPECGAKP